MALPAMIEELEMPCDRFAEFLSHWGILIRDFVSHVCDILWFSISHVI
jgi:hypothetical protein